MIESVTGKVVYGRGRGKKMAFPTINIKTKLDLPYGVYACRVSLPDGNFKGALHYGPRPAFEDDEVSFEVHIIGFDGDLYGETIRVDVYNRLRDIEVFKSNEALKSQISLDIENVKNMNF
jgi:riboflavin kinase/FMN adenylyltransferase